MKTLAECSETKSDPIITFSEKRSKINFQNSSSQRIRVVTIDGCIFKDEPTLRCDYLLVLPTNNNELYVELKGRGISHALEQIEKTIEWSLTALNNRPQKRYGFVVGSQYPKDDSKLKRLEKRINNKYNCRIKYKNKQLDIKILELL